MTLSMKDIKNQLINDRSPRIYSNSVVLITDVLYPDGDVIDVIYVFIRLSSDKQTACIQDNQGAINYITALGKSLPDEIMIEPTKDIMVKYGVTINKEGMISLSIEKLEDLSCAISVVANASAAFAEMLLNIIKD